MTNTVLIIEDDALLREIYAAKLELEGFTVDTAADGLTGLEKALANAPDIILLDMLMPHMNGIDFLRAYRPIATRPDVPTVIMSNKSSISDINLTRLLGVREYLIKSELTPDDVVAKVRHHLHAPTAEPFGD